MDQTRGSGTLWRNWHRTGAKRRWKERLLGTWGKIAAIEVTDHRQVLLKLMMCESV